MLVYWRVVLSRVYPVIDKDMFRGVVCDFFHQQCCKFGFAYKVGPKTSSK